LVSVVERAGAPCRLGAALHRSRRATLACAALHWPRGAFATQSINARLARSTNARMTAVAGTAHASVLAVDLQVPVSAPAAAYMAFEALLELYEDERTAIVPASALPAIAADVAESGVMAPHLRELVAGAPDYERLGRYAAGTPSTGLPRVLAFARTLVPRDADTLALVLALELLEDRARAGEAPAFDAARGAVLRAARYALPVVQLLVGADGDEAFATRVLRGAVLAKDAASVAFALERGARLDAFTENEQRTMRANVGEYALVLLELLRHVDEIAPELQPAPLLLAAVRDARAPIAFIAAMRQRIGRGAPDTLRRSLVFVLNAIGARSPLATRVAEYDVLASLLDGELAPSALFVYEARALFEYNTTAGVQRYTSPRPATGPELTKLLLAELCASRTPDEVLASGRWLRRRDTGGAGRYFGFTTGVVLENVLLDADGAIRRVSDALRMPAVHALLAAAGYEGVFTPDAPSQFTPFDVHDGWESASAAPLVQIAADAVLAAAGPGSRRATLREALADAGCEPPRDSWLEAALREDERASRKRVRANARAGADAVRADDARAGADAMCADGAHAGADSARTDDARTEDAARAVRALSVGVREEAYGAASSIGRGTEGARWLALNAALEALAFCPGDGGDDSIESVFVRLEREQPALAAVVADWRTHGIRDVPALAAALERPHEVPAVAAFAARLFAAEGRVVLARAARAIADGDYEALAREAANAMAPDGDIDVFTLALLAFPRFGVPLALALEAEDTGDAFAAAVRERGVDPFDAEAALEAALEALYDGADPEDGYGYEDEARARALVAIGARVMGLRRPLMDLFDSLRSAVFDD